MINPTLAEMATYPFVRLEEARRRLVDDGVDVLDFGKGDPNEPTDPIIRQALVDAIPERAPTVAPPSSSSLPPANPDLVPALDDAASAPAAERAEQIAEKQIASETV